MRRYIFIALGMVVLTAMITYSVMIWDTPVPEAKDQPENPKNSLSGLTLEPISPLKKVEKSQNNPVSQLLLQRYYSGCGHTVVEEVTRSPLLSMPREELLKLYSDWEVKENQGSRLVFYHKVNDLCPADLARRWVGEKSGCVTIFYGRPGMKEKIFRITQIPVEQFPLQIKANLNKGIPAESEDHLISIIEGLEVYINE